MGDLRMALLLYVLDWQLVLEGSNPSLSATSLPIMWFHLTDVCRIW